MSTPDVRRKNVAVDFEIARRLKVLAAERGTTIGALADQFLAKALGLQPVAAPTQAAEDFSLEGL